MKNFTLLIIALSLALSSFGQITWNYDYIETASSEAPDMVIDANNHLHVVYYKKTGWPWYSTYAYFDGSSWTTEDIVGSDGLHSIAVDNSNNPHVMYVNGGTLYHAWKNGGTWNTEPVDSSDYCSDNSIDIDASGHIHVSYTAGLMSHYLKYAYYDGTSWTLDTADSNSGGDGNSICVDSNNKPHILYGRNGLSYANWDGSNWNISNPCPSATASDIDGYITIDNSDHIHISYEKDGDTSAIAYKSYNGMSWTNEVIDINQNNATTGVLNSIFLDNSNNPHIAYAATNNWVDYYPKYTYYDGSSWNTNFIDTTEALYMGNMVPIKVVLSSNGAAHFIYTVSSSKGTQIKYATTGAYNTRKEFNKTSLATKCYPNPAGNQTKIVYQLDKKSDVNLVITDQSGRILKQKDIQQEAGFHQLNIDLSDLSSGYYYYTLSVNGMLETKTLSVIR